MTSSAAGRAGARRAWWPRGLVALGLTTASTLAPVGPMGAVSPMVASTLGVGAVAVGSLAMTACGEDEPEPVRVAKEFVRAARAGDTEEVLTLVDAQTVTRVEQAAERASDQVGGRRSVEAEEMLQVVDVDPRFQIKTAELRESDETHATVRIEGADETVHVLQLVNEDGAWRVRLPLPRGPMVEP